MLFPYQCETVQIAVEKTTDNPNGYVVINKTDFNADVHKLFGAEPAPAVNVVKQGVAPANPTAPSWKPA